MVDQLIRHINIRLLTVGHQHTDDPVLAQGFHAKGRHDGAVLAAGNTQHRIAIWAILRKELPNPIDAIIFNFYSIKHRLLLPRPNQLECR